MFYLYILQCRGNALYIGITNDLEKRLAYHSSGNVKYTKNRRPLILVYNEEYDDKRAAALREKQLKGWSRKKKEQLIEFGVPLKKSNK